MKVIKSRLLLIIAIFTLLSIGNANSKTDPPSKDGALVVNVTWGDLNNTPADDVYIEAHGSLESQSVTSSVLKIARAGRYEASLPPGLYDVFVSESTSKPVCKRFWVKPGSTTNWTLQLEIDQLNMDKQKV